ncbi:hypothetical protein ACTFIR_002313 [Dictyostelium discoideum]
MKILKIFCKSSFSRTPRSSYSRYCDQNSYHIQIEAKSGVSITSASTNNTNFKLNQKFQTNDKYLYNLIDYVDLEYGIYYQELIFTTNDNNNHTYQFMTTCSDLNIDGLVMSIGVLQNLSQDIKFNLKFSNNRLVPISIGLYFSQFNEQDLATSHIETFYPPNILSPGVNFTQFSYFCGPVFQSILNTNIMRPYQLMDIQCKSSVTTNIQDVLLPKITLNTNNYGTLYINPIPVYSVTINITEPYQFTDFSYSYFETITRGWPYGFYSGNNNNYTHKVSFVQLLEYSDSAYYGFGMAPNVGEFSVQIPPLTVGPSISPPKLLSYQFTRVSSQKYILRLTIESVNGILKFLATEQLYVSIDTLVSGTIYNGTFELITAFYGLKFIGMFDLLGNSAIYNLGDILSIDPLVIFQLPQEISFKLNISNFENNNIRFLKNNLSLEEDSYNIVYVNSSDIPKDKPMSFVLLDIISLPIERDSTDMANMLYLNRHPFIYNNNMFGNIQYMIDFAPELGFYSSEAVNQLFFPTITPIPTNPPQKCLGNPECGGKNQGICSSTGCICYSPWIGTTCTSQIIIVPQPSINTTKPNVEIPTDNNVQSSETNSEESQKMIFKSLISLVSLRELDFNNKEVNNYKFDQWIYTPINEFKNQYFTTVSNTNITATLEWFNQSTPIQFANQNLTMNPSSIKYTIEITEYQFKSSLNQLQLVMEASLTTNSNDICTLNQFGNTSTGDNSNYLKIQIENHSLYGRFIKRAIIDNNVKSISNVLLDSSLNVIDSSSSSLQSFIGITIPNYRNSIIVDLDFSVLIDSKSASDEDNSVCTKNNSGLTTAQLAGIIGSIAFAAVIIIGVIYIIIKKNKQKKFVDSVNRKMAEMNKN